MPHASGTRRPRHHGVHARVTDSAATLAAEALVGCYRELARKRVHLLAPILGNRAPVQWEHYPSDDAINRDRRYQWFYHSHDPEDRAGSGEHGHLHLFARMEGVADDIDERLELDYLRCLRTRRRSAATRHLIAIGLNPVGVPVSLFTVNRWVTGDLPLSGRATIAMLDALRLDTGHPTIDLVIQSILALYREEVRMLIMERDSVLMERATRAPGPLEDRAIEMPSSVRIDVDRRLAVL